jgi:hypothetical protein
MAKTSPLALCSGVIRPLTVSFQSCKKAYRSDKLLGLSPSPESGRVLLLTGVPLSDVGTEVKDLTPAWTETYEKASFRLRDIQDKLEQLKRVQQDRIQTAFGDVKAKDRDVAQLTSQITSVCLPQK